MLTGHSHTVTCVAVSKDGSLVVSGSQDGTVRAWGLSGDKITASSVLNKGVNGILALALSDSGDCLLTVREDDENCAIRVWTVYVSGKKVAAAAEGVLANATEGHTARVTCVAMSGDGTRAVTGAWDKTMCTWNVKERTLVYRLGGLASWVAGVALRFDGTVLSRSDTKVVSAYQGDEMVREFEGHRFSVRALTVTTDGKRLGAGT